MSQLTPDETILGLLAAQAQHGYQLLDAFADPNRLGSTWNMSTSQLYAVLKRLEREDLIMGQQVESENAPTRTEYAITAAGKERLDAWLNEPNPSPSVRRIRVEFLSRLYIARLLNVPTHAIVSRQAAACQQERDRIVAVSESRPPGVGRLASEFVIAQLDAVLGWIEQIHADAQMRVPKG